MYKFVRAGGGAGVLKSLLCRFTEVKLKLSLQSVVSLAEAGEGGVCGGFSVVGRGRTVMGGFR